MIGWNLKNYDQITISGDRKGKRRIKSEDGQHTLWISNHIQQMKRKDDQEFVGIYDGFYQGEACIVKVFLMLGGHEISKRATKEIAALGMLTDSKCKYTPQYLGDFQRHFDGLIYGIEHYVLMTKVPHQTLYSYRLKYPDLYKANKEAIQQSFNVAIGALHRFRVDNGSHHDENVMWDDKKRKCYIIDFGRATFHDWGAAEPQEWYLAREYSNWVKEG